MGYLTDFLGDVVDVIGDLISDMGIVTFLGSVIAIGIIILALFLIFFKG